MLTKILGHNSYGSIPHLKSSKFGMGDYAIPSGQEKILTKQSRDHRDVVIVTEKLDGSNVAIYKAPDGAIVPLTRRGYHCWESPYKQHHLFAKWVEQRTSFFQERLSCEERLCGEWLVQAHGIKYNLVDSLSVFAPFDIMVGHHRSSYLDLTWRFGDALTLPRLISYGPSVSVKWVSSVLKQPSSSHYCTKPEGAVWRVERAGAFDFMAKWVRPDMECGQYFPENTGQEEIWNIDLEILQ